MIDIVCVLLECSLRATRHLAVFVEFTLSNRCWTRPEEDVAANELAFLDALKGLVVARKCVCQFHIEDGIIIICNQAKNELYSLRAGGVGGGADNTSFLFQSISSTDHLTFSLNYYNITLGWYICD